MNDFELGATYRDVFSGFSGVAAEMGIDVDGFV
jgi:hypothetical protein